MSTQNTTEINIDPNAVIETLGDELGIYSVQIVILKHKMKTLSDYAANLKEHNNALQERAAKQDILIEEMRAELIKRESNHPGNRMKKN